tara:strand:+ start:1040 stop:1711 length:672 start_codon:yes stop_codon:yes gene_type:complete
MTPYPKMEENMITTKIPPPRTTAVNFGLGFNEEIGVKVKGDVFGVLQHEDGQEEIVLDKSNIYTLDGGILAALLFSRNKGTGFDRGIDMLAVGTGASGSTASPDIADFRQRKINNPLFRKGFTSVVYRTQDGLISNVPTNIVDFTTTFESSDAVGALTEMGLMSTKDGVGNNTADFDQLTDTFPDRNLTTDITTKDILVNYLTFPVINKPSGAILAITWRLTF